MSITGFLKISIAYIPRVKQLAKISIEYILRLKLLTKIPIEYKWIAMNAI